MAVTAACTFFIVNFCAETVNADSLSFASLDAFHAADTTRRAFLTGDCAFIVILAENSRLDFIKRHHFDKTVGTGFYTHLTSFANVGVDSGDAVADADCFVGADCGTVAETETTVNAFLGAAENLGSHTATLNALIFKLCCGVDVVTLTENNCCGGLDVTCGKTGDFADCL